MAYPRIEIKTEGAIVKTYIDGREIRGIRGITFECDAEDYRPRLLLDINAFNLSLDSHLFDLELNGTGIKKLIFDDELESVFGGERERMKQEVRMEILNERIVVVGDAYKNSETTEQESKKQSCVETWQDYFE